MNHVVTFDFGFLFQRDTELSDEDVAFLEDVAKREVRYHLGHLNATGIEDYDVDY